LLDITNAVRGGDDRGERGFALDQRQHAEIAATQI
jgi:hypothetical protein